MQNGSIDGRIVSAYPVKPEIEDEEGYDEYDELDEEDPDGDGGGGGGGDTGLDLKPWTDNYTVKGLNGAHTFGLSKTPWANPKMTENRRDYASVHLYWNGVFQRDLSYLLEDAVITVLDPEMKLRAGDELTVKYFYDTEKSGEVDENTYRMQCWVESYTMVSPDRPGYYIFWAGTLNPPQLYSNTGTITTTAGRYYSLQITGSWNSRFRPIPGQRIPTGDDVAGITWRVNFDPGADIKIETPGDDFYVKGNDYGSILCHKTCCGFEVGGDGCDCGSNNLPLLSYEPQNPPFNPTLGPIGGQVFAAGNNGIEIARYLNGRAERAGNNDRYGYNVERQMPYYSPYVPYNTGCTYAGGIANAEDTIYGKHSHETATYNVKIGVTATVIKK
jgi:hypothetical protein